MSAGQNPAISQTSIEYARVLGSTGDGVPASGPYLNLICTLSRRGLRRPSTGAR